jgi:hypothetical protein
VNKINLLHVARPISIIQVTLGYQRLMWAGFGVSSSTLYASDEVII